MASLHPFGTSPGPPTAPGIENLQARVSVASLLLRERPGVLI
jgi:hypothetical protein